MLINILGTWLILSQIVALEPDFKFVTLGSPDLCNVYLQNKTVVEVRATCKQVRNVIFKYEKVEE